MPTFVAVGANLSFGGRLAVVKGSPTALRAFPLPIGNCLFDLFRKLCGPGRVLPDFTGNPLPLPAVI